MKTVSHIYIFILLLLVVVMVGSDDMFSVSATVFILKYTNKTKQKKIETKSYKAYVLMLPIIKTWQNMLTEYKLHNGQRIQLPLSLVLILYLVYSFTFSRPSFTIFSDFSAAEMRTHKQMK